MRTDYVIERAAANVCERLAARGVDELAYAVALYSPDPAEVWTPPGSAWDQLGEEPQHHVLNRVAARAAAEHPLRAVTDDFVVYAFDEDFGDNLVANIRFSASPDALKRLEAKGRLTPEREAGEPPG
jgi:hypothetical protein